MNRGRQQRGYNHGNPQAWASFQGVAGHEDAVTGTNGEATEAIVVSEGAMNLGLSFDYLDKCIDHAKQQASHAEYADFHYYHNEGVPTICVVLYHPRVPLPTTVLTEAEGQHMQAELRSVATCSS